MTFSVAGKTGVFVMVIERSSHGQAGGFIARRFADGALCHRCALGAAGSCDCASGIVLRTQIAVLYHPASHAVRFKVGHRLIPEHAPRVPQVRQRMPDVSCARRLMDRSQSGGSARCASPLPAR